MDCFEDLPEHLTSEILFFTCPQEACKSSAISKAFKSAAESDALWERFLPPDYRDIISRSTNPVIFSTKKDLYFRLCDSPILIDGGKMSFALDKGSRKKCFMIGARELSIVWGDTPEYWAWIVHPQSRFLEVAELRNVCWLEIGGRMKTQMLSPKTAYTAYFVFKLADNSYGLLHARVTVEFVKERKDGTEEEQYLEEGIVLFIKRRRHRRSWLSAVAPPLCRQFLQMREDGWMEVRMGEFFNNLGDDGDVKLHLMETGSQWKSGLIIQGIELRPTEAA